MSRAGILSCVVLSVVAVGGCAWRFDRPMEEETTSVGSLERAERARTEAGRRHPECRDDRADRDRRPEGCKAVSRGH